MTNVPVLGIMVLTIGKGLIVNTRGLKMIRFKSEAKQPKPETIVYGEGSTVRERRPNELVHYRKDNDCITCSKCGGFATVWLPNEDSWSDHRARCC